MHGRVGLLFFVQDEEFRTPYRTITFPSSHSPKRAAFGAQGAPVAPVPEN